MKSILKFSRKVQILILLILCPLFAYGQSSWGKLHLINNPSLEEQARSLYERATKNNYASRSCLFQAIAFPVDRLSKTEVSVDYVNNEFVVRIGNRELYPDLPDWQLVPIVRFANNSYQGAFTSSGNTLNKESQLKYHPAFLDNLLGLRLFQANLLIIYPELLGEIPQDEKGNYILAASEAGLMPPSNPNAYKTLFNELKKNNIKLDSYILTDRDLEIFFDIDGDELSFSKNPYYYFSENNVASVGKNNLQEDLEFYYREIEKNAKTFLKEKYTPELNPRTNLKGLLKTLDENKQNEIFNPYIMHYIHDCLDKLSAILLQPNNETSKNSPQAMDDLIALFKNNWALLKLYNPLVYAGVENISHWSAFFRYIRLLNPDNWASFLNKIEKIKINAPIVQTPTSFVVRPN
jgi:hypothetical protein